MDKANNWIDPYIDADNLKKLFNCQCVRDKLVDDNIGLKCDKRGNYQPIQTIGNEYCVDLDGKLHKMGVFASKNMCPLQGRRKV